MKSVSKKFNKYFDNTINISAKILIIFVLSFYLLSVFFLQNENYTSVIKVTGCLLLFVFIISIYKFSSLIKNNKNAYITILICSVLLLGIWNIIYNSIPVSDYEVLLNGAEKIVNGSFVEEAVKKDNYFYFYNFQIGYAFYLSVFYKLFNGSLVAFKIVEIVTISLCNILVYKIMNLFFDVQKSFFTAILMTFNPYIFMGSGILNNQHISCLICLISIYIFLSKKSFLKYWICGGLIALSQVLRPTSVVILIAVFICCLILGITKKERSIIFGAFSLIVSYFVFYNLINMIFILTELAPIGIKGNNPYFKLLLGLTGNGITGKTTTDALHTQLYYDLQSYGFDYNAYKEAAKLYLKNLILNRQLSFEWIIEKMVYFAGSGDNQYHFGDAYFNSNHIFLIGILEFLGSGLYFISILFSLLGAIKEKETVKNKFFMLCILIFGLFFFAYVFIETQPRYRYEQYYLLFFLSMPLFYSALNSAERKLKEIL